MTEKYEAILKGSFDAIPESKLLPDGSWLLRCRNATFVAPKGDDGKGAKVLFFYQAKEAMEDVDADAMAALGSDYDLSENDIVAQFWADKNKDWQRIKDHLTVHGVNVSDYASVQEALEAVQGREVVGYLGTRTYTNTQGQAITDNTVQTFAKFE